MCIRDRRKQAEKLNWNNINFPASFEDIKTFEKNNGIGINVFGSEKGKIYPLYLSKSENCENDIDLLFLSNEKTNHYCWIKNLVRLLAQNGNSTHCCRRCLNLFTSRQALKNHKTYCDLQDAVRRILPEANKHCLPDLVTQAHSHSSSSSTRGRGGRSVRSPHGPILGAVEGVSSGQTTV